ncbi:acetyl-CoA C-acyltransferase, partial [Nocardia sp. NPDC060220]
MPKPVIVSAVRTAIARSFKGALVNVASETLAIEILTEAVRRSGIDPTHIDDVILAELNYGGGDLARHAAVAAGMLNVPGQAVNRHCAGSLTSIANAAAHIGVGMERVIVAGGVQSLSTAPLMKWRVPGSGPELEFKEPWIPPSHP